MDILNIMWLGLLVASGQWRIEKEKPNRDRIRNIIWRRQKMEKENNIRNVKFQSIKNREQMLRSTVSERRK